jgi:O-antigen ligase
MLVWSSIQSFYVIQAVMKDIWGDDLFPSFIMRIHRFFSIRDLFTRRVTGLSYEPSFLADQLVVLYLPLWLASVSRGYSVFSSRRSILSIELGFTLWGLAIIFLAQSRIGLLTAFSLLGVLGLVGAWKMAGFLLCRLNNWSRKTNGAIAIQKHFRWIRFLLTAVLVIIMIAAMIVVIWLASQIDERVEEILEIDFLGVFEQYTQPIYALANKMAYAERLMYWVGGMRVFSQYPILGVGLGNSGFYFLETIPAYGYRLPEIINIASGSPQFPNPKNLWIRLLAETGIIGFSLFVVWLILLALGAWALMKKGKDLSAVIGLAGLLAILAQVFEGFSLDTFALPHLWIMLGFLTAAVSMMSKSDVNSEAEV